MNEADRKDDKYLPARIPPQKRDGRPPPGAGTPLLERGPNAPVLLRTGHAWLGSDPARLRLRPGTFPRKLPLAFEPLSWESARWGGCLGFFCFFFKGICRSLRGRWVAAGSPPAPRAEQPRARPFGRGLPAFPVSQNQDNHAPPPAQAGLKAKSAAVSRAPRYRGAELRETDGEPPRPVRGGQKHREQARDI